MKKVFSLLVALLLALLPFSLVVHAATGTLVATVTVPNSPVTTIVFPDLSGGATSTAAVSATGSFTVDATSTTGTTTSIVVDGTELLGAAVDFTTDATLTASDLAAAINAHTSTSGFTASASGATVTVTAPSGSGTSTNGATFTITSSGDLAFSTAPFSGGVDAGAAASATSTSSHFVDVATSTADLSLSIGSTTIALTAGMTAAQAASTTAADINADSSNPYTATVVNADEVMLTAKASGTAGNGPVIASDLSYNGTAEVVTFTPASVTAGETYRVTINGTNYDYVALSGNTAADVTAALAPMIDANAAVSCTSSSTTITCTSSTAGTPFTASATVIAASSSGGSTALNPVTITSSNANTACAKPGDVVTLNFTASSTLGTSTTVMIAGHSANVVSLGSNMYAASTTLNASTTEGIVTFLISPFDTAGNAGTTTASTTNASTVTFVLTPPTITLNGNSPLHVAFGSAFSSIDPGATTTGSKVSVSNNANTSLNTQSAGTYTVTYTATDCVGNTATTTRTVIVDPAPLLGGHRQDVSNLFGTQLPPLGSSSGTVTVSDGSTIAYLLDPITIGPSGTLPLVPNTGVELFIFTRDLSIGMRGDDVAELQSRLFETGLLRVAPTGYFGSLTRDAVIRLQRGNGLTVTGTLNAQTRAMLNQS